MVNEVNGNLRRNRSEGTQVNMSTFIFIDIKRLGALCTHMNFHIHKLKFLKTLISGMFQGGGEIFCFQCF